MADSTITTNDNLLMSYFERKAVATLKANVAFYNICEKRPLPKGSGTSITFNAWRAIPAASGTLGETTSNTATALSSRKVSASIGSYGRAVKWSDTLELTSILPVEAGALAMLEQSAAETVDNVVQYAALKNKLVHCGQHARGLSGLLSAWMSALASAWCSNTYTAGDNANSENLFGFPVVFGTSCFKLSAMHAASSRTTSISANMGPIGVRKAVSRLKRLNVPPMADGKYWGVTHPNAIGSMLGNSDYKAWVQGYAQGPQETMYKHRVAEVHGVKLIESGNMPRYEGSKLDNKSKNLNLTLIVGMGALAMTELDGGIKYILHRPEQTANEFELYSTLAYKVRAAAAVLNPSCGVILVTQDMVAPITTIA